MRRLLKAREVELMGAMLERSDRKALSPLFGGNGG